MGKWGNGALTYGSGQMYSGQQTANNKTKQIILAAASSLHIYVQIINTSVSKPELMNHMSKIFP